MMKFVQGKNALAYFSFAYFVSLKRCFSLQSTLSNFKLRHDTRNNDTQHIDYLSQLRKTEEVSEAV
jgi:hypothetical protein